MQTTRFLVELNKLRAHLHAYGMAEGLALVEAALSAEAAAALEKHSAAALPLAAIMQQWRTKPRGVDPITEG